MAVIALTTAQGNIGINCIDIQPDNSRIVIGCEDGNIKYYRFEAIHKDQCILTCSSSIFGGGGITAIKYSKVKLNNEYMIACGSSEGYIELITRREIRPEKWSNLAGSKLHTYDIKDIEWINQDIISCGIDNIIYICHVSCNEDGFRLKISRKIRAHEGWVTGLAVLNNFILSQGSENKVKVWNYPSFAQVLEIRYEQEEADEESVEVIRKPSAGLWFALAGTRSGRTGEGCLTILRPENWNIIEIPLSLISSEGDTNILLKRKRHEENVVEVLCSGFLNKGLLVVTSGGYLSLFSYIDFTMIWETMLQPAAEITDLATASDGNWAVLSSAEGLPFYVTFEENLN
ncbi:HIR1_2 [Blepharisma stoltei]|uniref:Uncharacterized protein n=1 Tax=Blepharisma stoltei TaxID=1481888 RepID=A0AAU9JE44_9CILI|nr:unnamed protein product [Blepharisma stoltei]